LSFRPREPPAAAVQSVLRRSAIRGDPEQTKSRGNALATSAASDIFVIGGLASLRFCRVRFRRRLSIAFPVLSDLGFGGQRISKCFRDRFRSMKRLRCAAPRRARSGVGMCVAM
jgi:hypothetical protein